MHRFLPVACEDYQGLHSRNPTSYPEEIRDRLICPGILFFGDNPLWQRGCPMPCRGALDLLHCRPDQIGTASARIASR